MTEQRIKLRVHPAIREVRNALRFISSIPMRG